MNNNRQCDDRPNHLPARMRAVVWDGSLRLVHEAPLPSVRPGWALLRVRYAGICGTDLQILEGYKQYSGIPGHELVAVPVRHPDPSWLGRPVLAEINASCGDCDWCRRGLGRHCPNRRTMGIDGLAGCMADYCTAPVSNLVPVPDDLPLRAAVLVEPLAAACEILEQTDIREKDRVVVLGDGPIGILCAWVLATRSRCVKLIGHHPEKLKLAAWRGLHTALPDDRPPAGTADVVVDATGAQDGLAEGVALCRPRGTVVLKSTLAAALEIDLAPVVVNEIALLGSRCGRFADALALLAAFPDMPLQRLVTRVLPLQRARDAFRTARQPHALKVLLSTDEDTLP